MIVMEPKEETREEAKKRIFLAMMDAGKRAEFMAEVMHVDLKIINRMIKEEQTRRKKRHECLSEHLLEEWDEMHKGYRAYRDAHPIKER